MFSVFCMYLTGTDLMPSNCFSLQLLVFRGRDWLLGYLFSYVENLQQQKNTDLASQHKHSTCNCVAKVPYNITHLHSANLHPDMY